MRIKGAGFSWVHPSGTPHAAFACGILGHSCSAAPSGRHLGFQPLQGLLPGRSVLIPFPRVPHMHVGFWVTASFSMKTIIWVPHPLPFKGAVFPGPIINHQKRPVIPNEVRAVRDPSVLGQNLKPKPKTENSKLKRQTSKPKTPLTPPTSPQKTIPICLQ